MQKKAQLEFIAVLGIIAVLIVIGYYGYSLASLGPPSPEPAGVGEEQKPISDTITNDARSAAALAIKWLEQQGGFMRPDLNNSVAFTGVAVPYWQKCGAANAPALADATRRLEDAVANYTKASLKEKQNVFGKDVVLELNRLSVSAIIQDNKIDFSVTLPGIVKGKALASPMKFSVPAMLGELMKFGRGFVEDNTEKRYLEQYTIATIYFSGELETQGALAKCGESIFLSGAKISQGLENAIRYTLANTVWWQKMGNSSGQQYKTYSIETVDGKKYNFEPGFYLPDGFGLGPSTPLSVTNNRFVLYGLFTIPACLATYNWKYSVSYPVIVRARDTLTGNNFNFAVLVDVREMQAGGCQGATGPVIESGADCSAAIRVVDSSNKPLAGAVADFAGYYIGESGGDGMVTGRMPCGKYELYAGKPGYGPFASGNITPAEVNRTVVLMKTPTLGLNFSNVEIKENSSFASEPSGRPAALSYVRCAVKPADRAVLLNFSSGGKEYLATNIDSGASSPDSARDCDKSADCAACRETKDGNACYRCASICTRGLVYWPYASVDYVPGGSYSVDSSIINMETGHSEGGFFSLYNIPEHNLTLNIYTPLAGSVLYRSITDTAALASALKLRCGMDTMTTAAKPQGSLIRMSGCSCTQLRGMTEAEFGECIGPEAVRAMFTPDTAGCAGRTACMWSCDKANVTAAVSACGFELKGC